MLHPPSGTSCLIYASQSKGHSFFPAAAEITFVFNSNPQHPSHPLPPTLHPHPLSPTSPFPSSLQNAGSMWLLTWRQTVLYKWTLTRILIYNFINYRQVSQCWGGGQTMRYNTINHYMWRNHILKMTNYRKTTKDKSHLFFFSFFFYKPDFPDLINASNAFIWLHSSVNL